jgi:hypothetical protein
MKDSRRRLISHGLGFFQATVHFPWLVGLRTKKTIRIMLNALKEEKNNNTPI